MGFNKNIQKYAKKHIYNIDTNKIHPYSYSFNLTSKSFSINEKDFLENFSDYLLIIKDEWGVKGKAI